MKSKLLLVIVLVLAGLAGGVVPAEAAVSGVTVQVGCSSVKVTFTTTDPGVYELHSHAYDSNWDELIAYEYGGFVDTPYHYIPLSGAGTYSFTIPYNRTLPEGSTVNFDEIHLHSTGPDDFVVIVSGVYTCSSSYAGPGVPAGYVLKYITCDVAVFNAPGGTPIGSDAVKAGQTFYVNPTPKTAPDGESWTQVFVSSTPDPWIPTRCVQ
ncbi:MAG: hypothetical protein IAE83_13150 [Anaerolinea sp.]|nr:hypothetical protein [Anaerolinea sp.]MCC6975347.1 hypothetical protein [Anaerolineae bacterium]CAG1010280.1 hypothetical protein ANRL4_04167 [Anaerolineae bacterium]